MKFNLKAGLDQNEFATGEGVEGDELARMIPI